MPTPLHTPEGLVAISTVAARWHLSPPEARAVLVERKVEILTYSVSNRKVELVREAEANDAILRHITPKPGSIDGETYKPLTEKLAAQARELEVLKENMAAIMRGLGVTPRTAGDTKGAR